MLYTSKLFRITNVLLIWTKKLPMQCNAIKVTLSDEVDI